MNLRTRQNLLSFLLLAFSSLAPAAPLDFDTNPIDCSGPSSTPGAGGSPIDCTLAQPRPDGYAIKDATFTAFFFPAPPFPGPSVVKWGSDRDFNNPVDQDLFVFIFGDTEFTLFGPPVTFFVSGTLDGDVVVSFSTVIGASGPVAWNAAALVPDVPAGMHTLDMEFGVIGFAGSQVSFSSLYQVGAAAVPTPGSVALLLGGALVLFGIRQRRAGSWASAA